MRAPWWITLPFGLGFGVLSIVAPTFFGVTAQAIFGLLAIALILFGVCAWSVHGRDEHPRCIRFPAIVVAFVLGALVASPMISKLAWPEGPSGDDFSVAFIPDHLDNSGLNGRVVVRSSATEPISIDAVRISSPDAVVRSEEPTVVRTSQPASFPFREYFWRGATVSFEAHYSINEEPAEKAITAKFIVPARPGLGEEIEPTIRRDSDKSDFAALARRDARNTANSPEGCKPTTVVERRPDGSWNRMREQFERRVFIFDPVERQARMGSVLRDEWYWLSVPIEQTIDGLHQLRFCWHEANGYMAIEADNTYAVFDVDTGEVERGDLR